MTTPFTTTTARTTAPYQVTTLPGGTTLSSITGSNLPLPGQSQIFTTTNIPRSRGESRVDFTTLEPRGSTGQSKVPSKALQFSSPSKLISHDYFLSSLSGECFSRRVIPLSTLLTNLINKHPQINPCYLSDYNHAVKSLHISFNYDSAIHLTVKRFNVEANETISVKSTLHQVGFYIPGDDSIYNCKCKNNSTISSHEIASRYNLLTYLRYCNTSKQCWIISLCIAFAFRRARIFHEILATRAAHSLGPY